MFFVAVTGGIATGKSTVSRVFEKNGVPVIDADKIAREIVEPGKPCWKKIRDAFGDEVLHPSKEINRQALGKLIFSNREARLKINKITHPIIHRTIYKEAFKHFMSGRAWIVLDMPLLFESGILMDFIHKIITVSCEPDQQLHRLMKRNEYSEEEARRRIESQMPLEKKCEMSNFVISNNGSIAQTEEEAERIFLMINESKHHWHNRITLLGILLAIIFVGYYMHKAINMFL